MDLEDPQEDKEAQEALEGDIGWNDTQQPRDLPPDLPKSLDDRRDLSSKATTEIYDAWQGA